MGKISKEDQWRREGMAYALRIAEAGGVEALRDEVRRRGADFVPVGVSKRALDEFTNNVKTTTVDTICAICELILHDKYGWGKKRLTDFANHMNRYADMILEDYLTVEDAIGIIREECGIDLPYRRNDRSIRFDK